MDKSLKTISASKEAGLSLIAVLVALGLGSVLAVGMASIFKNSMSAQSRISNDVEKEAVKMQLLNQTSCEATATQTQCASAGSGKLIRLLATKSDGTQRVLVTNAGKGTRIGKFTVRAECDGDGGAVVRLAMLRNSGSLTSTSKSDFMEDPLTGNVHTWSDKETLAFGSGVSLCGGTADVPVRLIDVLTRVTNTVSSISVPVPPGTSVVKLRAWGQNLANYGAAANLETEDHAELVSIADFRKGVSSGTWIVTGGSGDENTIAINWNAQSLGSLPVTSGDKTAVNAYDIQKTANLRPMFTLSADKKTFTISGLTLYAPARFTWLFEFYGS